ncbi:MAG: PAS domain S-box protein [Terriglobales bacterium]
MAGKYPTSTALNRQTFDATEPERRNGEMGQTLTSKSTFRRDEDTSQGELLREFQALRRSEANLRDFVETAAIGLHWVSGEGIVLWANQAELDLLGYPREDYIGRHIAAFHADEPVLEDILARLSRGDALREYPARLRHQDGSIRHVLISSSALFEDGRFVHTCCFTRDVTARNEAVERLQEQSRLDAFAAQIGKHLIESGNLPDMLHRCTQTMVDQLGAVFARIWTLNRPDNVLELQASSGIYTRLDGSHARVPVGSLKIGRIAAERKPHLTNQVIGDPRVPEQEWARREGMVAFAGYPLIIEDRLLGVMAMFSRHALSDVTLQAMARVADQIAVGIERKRVEQALRESEGRLHELVEALPAAIYTTDAHGRITMFNQAAVEFSGRVPTLGSDAWSVSWKLYETDGTPLPHDRCPMAIALQEGRPVRGCEAIAERPDGTRRNFIPYPTPLYDGSGRLKGAVNMCVDITDRKRAEEALRKSQAQLQVLFHEAPVGMLLVDADMHILHVNPKALPTFGDIGTLIDRDLTEVMRIIWPRETADQVVGQFRHTRDTGEPYRALEFSEERADSNEREYYDYQLHRITLPDGQNGVVAYFSDISAHVLARRLVAESEERLRFMAESMPQKIFTARPNGDVDYFNQQWTAFTGLSFEDIKNWGWTQFIHPDDVEESIRLWRHSVESGEPFHFVHRFMRADGVYWWHLSRAHAMRDAAGTISMWIGSTTEIQEEKETEAELRRANEDLNQFAFAASHDLQEPLRMITSYSQLLVKGHRGQLDDESTLCKRYIEEGTRRMRELLADLLSYTEAAGDKQDLAQSVDLNRVMEKATQNLHKAIEESGAVITRIDLPSVYGHEVHFIQLFQNLIGNAIKYRAEREPRIHVDAERRNDEWRFAVTDNGIGIAPEYHQKIFGVFKRLHGPKIPGTGIGLAICQRVAARYNGRLWVESQPDQGATFYFTLPMATGVGISYTRPIHD